MTITPSNQLALLLFFLGIDWLERGFETNPIREMKCIADFGIGSLLIVLAFGLYYVTPQKNNNEFTKY
jgi:hypothetical protein